MTSTGVLALVVLVSLCGLASAQPFTNHRGPWNIVFKLPNNAIPTGYSSIISFWQASGSYNDISAAKSDFSSSSQIFKSAWLDDWDKRSFSAVRLSAYKDNKEVAYVVFDSMGKSKNEWMDCANIIDSSYTDITSSSRNYCDMDTTDRDFYISHSHGGCSNDIGWFILKDFDSTSGCSVWDPVTGSPYFKYALDNTMSNWESGNTDIADCMVISVMAWDMVFKGVQGVVPPQGGLRQLWQGTDTLNSDNPAAQTLTRSPELVYKSINVEQWRSVPGFFIESVKYAMFVGGKEVAFSIYDGRDTDKNGWFVDERILYSRWTDILGYTKVGSSIDGDGIRRFALWKEHGGCPNDKAWMAILDSSDAGNQPCSWDKDVQTRPYFLYSNKRTWALCESGGAWNSAEFPAAETLAIFIKGWRMVMKVAHGQSISPASSVYDLYTGTYTVNEYDSSALTIAAGSNTYKSHVIDNWDSYSIDAVRISFYKDDKEVAYVVFDAHGSTKNNWFDCSRILYTSFSDLDRLKAVSYCGMEGDPSHQRRFFIQNNYGGCNNDAGWFVVVEGHTCSWEDQTTRPFFLYSTDPGYQLQDSMTIADVLLFSVVMDNCSPNPCQNSGTCYDEGMDYTCTCSGDWIGQRCTDLNGGWSDWGTWGSCSVTCGGGTRSRDRTCTNPTPIGIGATCSGDSSSTETCNTQNCPIDGQWGSWGSWGSCSLTCGGGLKSRSRNCDNPAPQYNGADCVGNSTSDTDCNTHNCPIDGSWGAWGSWQDCSVSCGGGIQYRNRNCSDPYPQYGGADCVGNDTSSQDCNTQVCIIDGAWGSWLSWGTCSVTCGGGRKSRSRVCDNPAPANGGLSCSGDSGDFSDCNTQNCPTVAAGTYQQLCPTNWFTCETGGITCIDETFKCDCSADCDDASDETLSYAGCSQSVMLACSYSAAGLARSSTVVLAMMTFVVVVAYRFL